MQSACEDYVVLAGGLTVSRAAIHLAIDLELRGFRLEVAGPELVVRSSDLVTEADCAAVRRWNLHLMALVAYQPPTPHWLH